MNVSTTGTPARLLPCFSSTRARQSLGQALPNIRAVPPVGGLVRLVSLFASAWVLTTSISAQAQEQPEPMAPAADADPAEADLEDDDVTAMIQEAEEELSGGEERASAEVSGPQDTVSDEDAPIDEVVVTGYRKSLGLALRKKQRAVGQLDAIVADDIADFPDLNLAEALQRVPGVALSRENGEGKRITVRGLSGLYTRVRLNGMEARGSVADNATRQFDFNLFASELFNSVVIHKSAAANLDEGSLGATVDMNTARAFDYKTGFTTVANVVGGYNDLSTAVMPRLTGLMAYHDPSGIWGAAVSAAYQGVRLDTVSTDTVAWQKAPFGSVDGVNCADNAADPGCVEANDAFHPRIPRFGQNELRGDRLGLTGGVQLRPGMSTEIRLDALYSQYDWQNSRRRLFPLIRNNEGQASLSDYMISPQPDRFGLGNDSLIAGSLDNAWIRSENERYDAEARFQQLTLAVDHDFTGEFYLRGLAGITRSSSGRPHSTTINYDNRSYNGYRFDLTDDQAPVYAFEGLDVTDPANFVVPELRDRVAEREGGFENVQLDFHYDIDTPLNFVVGVNYKRATYTSYDANRDGTVCGLGLVNCDTNGDGEDDILGPTGVAERTTQLNYRGGAGAGSATQWAVPDADAWISELGYYDVPLSDNVGREEVTEIDLGGFLQARGEVSVGSMRLLYDGGMRVVQTRQTSQGLVPAGEERVEQTIKRDYVDWLPAANAALWLNEETVVRVGAARVMSRPQLSYLSPSVEVDSFGYGINFQNPNLDPTRANAFDVGIEWYFGEDSLLSFAAFAKDIDSFPTQESVTSTFAATGLPRNAIFPLSPADDTPGGEGNCGVAAGCWNVTQRINGPGAVVMGFEAGVQAPFRSVFKGLPMVLKDMGVLLNYTYVDAEADYDFLGNPITERLLDLSNSSVNSTLYYDDSRFSARASVAYRSDFLTQGPVNQGNLWVITEPNMRLDLSSSYSVSDDLRISLEALNVTDSAFSNVLDIDANRRGVYNKFGRTIFLGARYSYNN